MQAKIARYAGTGLFCIAVRKADGTWVITEGFGRGILFETSLDVSFFAKRNGMKRIK